MKIKLVIIVNAA